MLRTLTPDDLGAVHRINQQNVPAVGDESQDKLAWLLAASSIAVADEDDTSGRLAGFCLVLLPGTSYGSDNYRWFSRAYDDFVYLDRVAFDAAFQGQGRGTAMYAEVERQARTLRPGAPFTLEVNLRPRNDGSLRFHHRLGFAEVGRQETSYGSLVSLMAKPLPAAAPDAPPQPD